MSRMTIHAEPNMDAQHPEVTLVVHGRRVVLSAADAVSVILALQDALGEATEEWVRSGGLQKEREQEEEEEAHGRREAY